MAALPRVVATGLALVLATDAFLVYGARAADPVPLRDAVARFRSSPSASPGPPEGVYLYDTTGYAHVDSFAITRTYPRVTTRVVRGHGCGWREEVLVFDEHVETYDHCAAFGAAGAPAGFGTRLTYFFVPSVTSLTCRGETCEDPAHGVSARLTVSDGGPGSVAVDGVGVPCRRTTYTTVLRGSNAGSAHRTVCLRADGLVLSEERSVGLVADSAFVGRVTYTEQATFTIRSLDAYR